MWTLWTLWSIGPEVPHRRRGTIIDPHTAKQKSKICPGVTLQDLPFQGSGSQKEREGNGKRRQMM